MKDPEHPWWRFTGEVVGPMSTPAGDGLRVALDNGCESFVTLDQWESFDG